MGKETEGHLIPVGRQLREELNKYGEHVTPSTMIDPAEGRLWKKNSSGRFREITVNSRKVLIALDHYREQVESTRRRCRESREEKL